MENKYPEPAGKVALWIKEGKNGKFFSGRATFAFGEEKICINLTIYRNNFKKGKQPDYKGFVTKASAVTEQEGQDPETQTRGMSDDLPF